MTTQIALCLIIFLMMILAFAFSKLPLGVSATTAALLLVWTGCIKPAAFLTGLGNANTIIIVGMFVIGAGLKRTTFCDKLGNGIAALTKGSFTWSYRLLIVVALILTGLMTSPAVSYSIMYPLMDAVNKKYDVKPSKTQFPLALICVAGCAVLPFGFAISEAAVFNGLMETYGFTQGFTPMDFFTGRWPMLIIATLWAWFIAPKVTPEEPSNPIVGLSVTKQEPLSKVKDIIGALIYLAVILLLIFGAKLKTINWVVVLSGCMLLIICGVLTAKEGIAAMPIDIGLIFIGANAMAGALINTGAADYLGKQISGFMGTNPNPWVLSIVFFILPFIFTQFSLNQGIINIFAPIALITCRALNADPRGILVLICAGGLTAFMTPGATPAVPMTMGAGGYNLKDLFKMGWLFSVIAAVFYIIFVTLTMPAFH